LQDLADMLGSRGRKQIVLLKLPYLGHRGLEE
jgi:hypothetical protein